MDLATVLSWAIVLGTALICGMGLNLLVCGRQRESRVVGAIMILVGFTFKFVFIALALYWLLSQL